VSTTPERSKLVLSLFNQHYDRVYAFARRSLAPSQAEDIAQEVFTRLLGRENLETMTISVSYLFRIADNLIKRRYQRACRFNRYLEYKTPQVASGSRDTTRAPSVDRESEREAVQKVERAMSLLSEKEKEAVRLIAYSGMSYKAAACSMGVRVSTINNWNHRGMQKIRDYHDTERQAKGDKGEPVALRPTG
jgi:RNA polymerase sigma factor (sigma-70 family)